MVFREEKVNVMGRWMAIIRNSISKCPGTWLRISCKSAHFHFEGDRLLPHKVHHKVESYYKTTSSVAAVAE